MFAGVAVTVAATAVCGDDPEPSSAGTDRRGQVTSHGQALRCAEDWEREAPSLQGNAHSSRWHDTHGRATVIAMALVLTALVAGFTGTDA